MTRVYLTGASGFVGAGLLSCLSRGPFVCTAVLRNPQPFLPRDVRVEIISSLTANANFQAGLAGQDLVIHCAARAHVMKDQSSDSLAEFRKVNVEGTLNLARQAAAAGVRRFIFISSVGVNGNQSSHPFNADDVPNPIDPYAISKFEAELGLRRLSTESGMDLVIIRPPLVYGPNAPGNFARLINIVAKGMPLPFGAIQNSRSLVALDNLVDLIVTCIDHPAAANQTFLVSDGEDLSTTELLRRMGVALGRPARLLPVPTRLLEVGAAMLGKPALARRLCGSLQVDISKTHELLGWSPPVGVDEALRRTAVHFLAAQNGSDV